MMKKTNKLFFAMCMLGGFAVLFGSCKKNEEVDSATVGLPAFEEEVDGRAYIDYSNGNKFKWNANDQIMVYNLDKDNGTNSEKDVYQTTADTSKLEAECGYKPHWTLHDGIGKFMAWYKSDNNPLKD